MIKKFYLVFCLTILLLISSISLKADILPGVNSNTNTFLGPIWQGQATFLNLNDSSLSGLVEAGQLNYRLGATYGWALNAARQQRFKVSGEYLWQDLDYHFFTGVSQRWVSQAAAGAAYEYYLPGNSFLDHLDLDAYYSYAPSKGLSPVNSFFMIGSRIETFTDYRRIAGSNAGGGSAGFAIHPWSTGTASLAVNYDDVIYNTKFQSDENARGIGGTATFEQYLGNNLRANISAAVRAPFNNYQAGVDWTIPKFSGAWDLGVFGGYVVGKNRLPNSSIVGVSLKYLLQSKLPVSRMVADASDNGFRTWATTPAVHMPQVLAIADERVQIITPAFCTPPALSGTLIPSIIAPLGTVFLGLNGSIAFVPQSGLIFTLIGDIAPDVTIDPITGVISGPTTVPGVFAMQVQATNNCGTATSNIFTITVIPI